jgi:hypothetical protein
MCSCHRTSSVPRSLLGEASASTAISWAEPRKRSCTGESDQWLNSTRSGAAASSSTAPRPRQSSVHTEPAFDSARVSATSPSRARRCGLAQSARTSPSVAAPASSLAVTALTLRARSSSETQSGPMRRMRWA